jgi:hypothetical protein
VKAFLDAVKNFAQGGCFEHPKQLAKTLPQDPDPVTTYAPHALANKLALADACGLVVSVHSFFPNETKLLKSSLSKGGFLRTWQKYPHITQIPRSTRPNIGRFITTTMTARMVNASKLSIAKMEQVESRCARSAVNSADGVDVPGAANAAAPPLTLLRLAALRVTSTDRIRIHYGLVC